MNESQKIAHLYRRFGFGLDWFSRQPATLKECISQLLDLPKLPELLTVAKDERVDAMAVLSMKGALKEELIADLAANVKLLNLEWLMRMGATQKPLQEKLALFWHGHLALRGRGVKQVAQYLDTLRVGGAGSFRMLLHDVSKEPAMLRFLNAAQNRKNSPNENFARELMELFTLGRGHYTEQDIKEAARAFTGWSIRNEQFFFNLRQHDMGIKQFRGRSGNFKGEDIIDQLLDDRQTARHLVQKFWMFFIGSKLNSELIEDLSRTYFESGYQTQTLLKQVMESNWFYDSNIATPLIKSPTELISCLIRQLGFAVESPTQFLPLQRLMGQMLFFPPNVSGWAGGRNWIDNSTLAVRLQVPALLMRGDELETEATNYFNDEEGKVQMPENGRIAIRGQVNWAKLEQKTQGMSLNALADAWAEKLYYPGAADTSQLLRKLENKSFDNQRHMLSHLFIALTGHPAYQIH